MDLLHFELGAELLPEARFVQIHRDVRDVICSMLTWAEQRGRPEWLPPPAWPRFRGSGFLARKLNLRLEIVDTAARMWADVVGTGLDLSGGTLAHRLRTVRYEQLVGDPTNQLGELVDWLGIGSSPELEAFLAPDARTTADARSIGRYRSELSDRELRIIERRAGAVLRRLEHDG
jgi:hypothetical protein